MKKHIHTRFVELTFRIVVWSLRHSKKLALGLLAGFLLALLLLEISAYRARHQYPTEKADAILLLSGGLNHSIDLDGRFPYPGPMSKARLLLAVKLWREKLAEKIIVAGGPFGPKKYTNIGCELRQRLIEFGVPEENVIVEGSSRSTYENLRNSIRLMREIGVNDFILVTDDFHITRAQLMLRFFGRRESAIAASSGRSDTFFLFAGWYTIRELLAYPYNLAKIIYYPMIFGDQTNITPKEC